MRINRSRIDPSTEAVVSFGLQIMYSISHVSITKDEKYICKTILIRNTHARGHLKKRRPPSISLVHIYTKQSSPWRHFGQSSFQLSYPLRGFSWVKSLLVSTNTASSKKWGPREPSHTMVGPSPPPSSTCGETLSSRRVSRHFYSN